MSKARQANGEIKKSNPYSGVIYKKFSEVPQSLLTRGYEEHEYLEHFAKKCQICADSRIQDECMSKLSLLTNLLSRNKEEVNVLDYGGGFGQILFGLEKYLVYPERIKWNVIDTEGVVKAAKENIKGKKNSLYFTDISRVDKIDILFFRQSLQVLENYKEIITQVSKKFGPKFIVISGVMAGKNNDYITLLLLDGNKGVPCIFLNENKLINFIKSEGYLLVDKFRESIKVDLDNFSDEYHLDEKKENLVKSYIFVREGIEI